MYLKLLNILAKNILSILPDGYSELNYIRSTGTQYIFLPWTVGDFGYDGSGNYEYTIEFSIDSQANGMSVIGAGSSSDNNWSGNLYTRSSGNYAIWAGNNPGNNRVVNLITDVIYTIHYSVYNDTFLYEIKQGTSVIYSSGELNLTVSPINGSRFAVFAYNKGGTITSLHRGLSIYSLKYRENDFESEVIPCLRLSDMTPGMYDIGNGIFLQNSGIGVFLY